MANVEKLTTDEALARARKPSDDALRYLGGVDAVPICLATSDPDELIHTVKLLQPAFGGINLEDIAQPKCFRIPEPPTEGTR